MCQVLAMIPDEVLRKQVSVMLTSKGHIVKTVVSAPGAMFELGVVNSAYECIVLQDCEFAIKLTHNIRGRWSKLGIIVITDKAIDVVGRVFSGLDVWSILGRNEIDRLDDKIKKACTMTEMSETRFFNVKKVLSDAAAHVREVQQRLAL
jgi:hypothetical protein